MSAPAYSEYKDTGVLWFGRVPSHWEVVRFKNVFLERDERSTLGAEELLSVSAYTGVSPRSEIVRDGDHLSRAESLEGYKICYPNDLVMNIMLAWNRGLGISKFHGIVSPAYCVFKIAGDSESRFLDYLVRSDECIGYFKTHSSGVIDSRLRLYPDSFGALFCALPPRSEQIAIASFLDRETGKIDALVEEQRRLITLLKEKRQAVISHAVTKGLDPNAPTKDSGVEWLGEMPAHWETKRLRFVAKLNPSKSEIANLDRELELSFLPMDAVGEEGSLRLDELRPIHAVETGYTFFGEGDVGFAKITPCFENGKGAIMRGLVGGFGFGTTELTILRPIKEAIEADFLNWILRSSLFRGLGEGDMYGAGGQKRVPDDFVRQYVAVIPPLPEQSEINRFLLAETEKFDQLLANAECATTLLAERRAALISAAVTGKIDVRGLVPAGLAAA